MKKIRETKRKVDFTTEKKSDPKIPGLDLLAVDRSTDDINLAPLSSANCKLIQYGGERFFSTSTDHPYWVPGDVFTINKYVGKFRSKVSGFTKEVN